MALPYLAQQLEAGGHTLVVANGSRMETYNRPGVADLLTILNQDMSLLHGASVADKVVGKAAAALMAMGGVRDVYAFTLSRQAVEMLNARGIPWSCGEMVDHIVNRDGTGWCPMELCCRDCTTPDQCHAAIIKKIEEFKNKRQ